MYHGPRWWFLALVLAGCGGTFEPVPDHPACEASGGGVHVATGAAGGAGCGDAGSPCASPAEALDTLRQTGGGGAICLGSGTWANVAIQLSGSFTGGVDDDTIIIGMGDDGAGASILLGGTTQAVVEVAGEASGVQLENLRVVGGYRGVVIRESAGGTTPIVVSGVTVEGSTRLGVLISGAGTSATLMDVRVEAPATDGGAFGWGIAIQQGLPGLVEGPPIELLGVEVVQATGLGVLIDGSHAELDGVDVIDTLDLGGSLGRGVQSQSFSYGTMNLLSVDGAADAGLFIDRPGRSPTAALVLADVILAGVGGASDPASGSPTGDALVVMQDANEPPDSYFLDIGTVQVQGQPARASAVFDDVTPASCNSIFGDGTLYIWQQIAPGEAPPSCPGFAAQDPPLDLYRFLAPEG